MNTTELKTKVEDVIQSLTVALSEVEQIENKRVALEASQVVNTQREERLNGIAKTQVKERQDLDAQKTYIEEQNKNSQTILTRITSEKEALKGLAELKQTLGKEKEDIEIARKDLVGLKQEKEVLQLEWANLLKQKSLFEQEKQAMIEQTKLIAIKEQNIKEREERLDKIERMTQI